jgi:BirA family biotin operon repressor/biotin-[acetyl-CoA-carboxylase] ligase
MSDDPTERLDAEKILRALSPVARAEVQAFSIALKTGSTQVDALAAATPAQGCAIFFAEQQTAGQGRHGRPWISPPSANLYFSVSRRFALPMSALSGLSLAVGVSLCEALHSQGFDQVRVKWPNDLLAEGRKLGGILIQLRSDDSVGTQAVIGVGINVRMPAAQGLQVDQAWCDLAQLAPGGISRDAVAGACLDQLLPVLARFAHEGLVPFLPRWRDLDALAGKPVRILDGSRVHEGISLGIDPTGALRIGQGGGEQSFHSGEVSLRPV